VCYLPAQPREGLRILERWAKRFPKRRWAVENAGGLGRHLAQRLAAAGELVVDVPSKLLARVRVLSSFAGNARKNDELDALATALAAWRYERLAVVEPEAGSEVLRLLSERREDLVAERTRAFKAACTDSCGTSCPVGYRGYSRPPEPRASCAANGPRAPRPGRSRKLCTSPRTPSKNTSKTSSRR
jgi:Transposase